MFPYDSLGGVLGGGLYGYGVASHFNPQPGGYPLYADQLLAQQARQQFYNDQIVRGLQNAEAMRPKPKPSARIGKVTMKPGVIKDGNDYRWKTWKDYKLWERVIIWFNT